MWFRFPLRVLIVDDKSNKADSLRSVVEQLGCYAETANGGRDALDVASHFHPQAVVVDIVIQVMDGYQTIVEMKKHSWARDTRFVAHPLSQNPLRGHVIDTKPRKSLEATPIKRLRVAEQRYLGPDKPVSDVIGVCW